MTETPALKPCPFCGNSEIESYGSTKHSFWFECNSCGAAGPLKDTLETATTAWNNRALDAERDELVALKAIMQDPEAVRVNILRGTIARPNDLIFKHDENGDYARIVAENKIATNGLSAFVGKVMNAQINLSTGKTKAQVDAALTEALRDARATLTKVKQ